MPTLMKLSKLLRIPRVRYTKDFIAMIQAKDEKIVEVETAEQILGEQNAILKRDGAVRETFVAALEEKVATLEEEVLEVAEVDDTIVVLKDVALAMDTSAPVRAVIESDNMDAGIRCSPSWIGPHLRSTGPWPSGRMRKRTRSASCPTSSPMSGRRPMPPGSMVSPHSKPVGWVAVKRS